MGRGKQRESQGVSLAVLLGFDQDDAVLPAFVFLDFFLRAVRGLSFFCSGADIGVTITPLYAPKRYIHYFAR